LAWIYVISYEIVNNNSWIFQRIELVQFLSPLKTPAHTVLHFWEYYIFVPFFAHQEPRLYTTVNYFLTVILYINLIVLHSKRHDFDWLIFALTVVNLNYLFIQLTPVWYVAMCELYG
jgi:hypothetical protein